MNHANAGSILTSVAVGPFSSPLQRLSQRTDELQRADGLQQTGHTTQLYAVSERKRSGLILCKGYYAEFTGPGAVLDVPFEAPCIQVVGIGAPELVALTTAEDRQRAYSRRIQWLRWLERITDDPVPSNRAEKLLLSLEAFFDTSTLADLPDQPLALLAGVFPHTMAQVRSQLPNQAHP